MAARGRRARPRPTETTRRRIHGRRDERRRRGCGKRRRADLQILTQYVRDLSFENIAAQKGVASEGKPDVRVQVDIDAQQRPADHYEVVLKVKVNSEIGRGAGLHPGARLCRALPDPERAAEQMHPLLMIECPRLIFPFLRRIVSDVTRDGGYPPLNLEQVDFLRSTGPSWRGGRQQAASDAGAGLSQPGPRATPPSSARKAAWAAASAAVRRSREGARARGRGPGDAGRRFRLATTLRTRSGCRPPMSSR